MCRGIKARSKTFIDIDINFYVTFFYYTRSRYAKVWNDPCGNIPCRRDCRPFFCYKSAGLSFFYAPYTHTSLCDGGLCLAKMVGQGWRFIGEMRYN